MSFVDHKSGQALKFVVDANYYISVLVLLYCGFTAVTESFNVFKFDEELWGAMHNNLRMVLLYLAMTEVVIFIYCFATKQPKLMLYVGFFMVMMLGSLAFYGKINGIPIDQNLHLFFLYVGSSHIVFGLLSGLDRSNSSRVLD